MLPQSTASCLKLEEGPFWLLTRAKDELPEGVVAKVLQPCLSSPHPRAPVNSAGRSCDQIPTFQGTSAPRTAPSRRQAHKARVMLPGWLRVGQNEACSVNSLRNCKGQLLCETIGGSPTILTTPTVPECNACLSSLQEVDLGHNMTRVLSVYSIFLEQDVLPKLRRSTCVGGTAQCLQFYVLIRHARATSVANVCWKPRRA